jgi:hypothetical protein
MASMRRRMCDTENAFKTSCLGDHFIFRNEFAAAFLLLAAVNILVFLSRSRGGRLAVGGL